MLKECQSCKGKGYKVRRKNLKNTDEIFNGIFERETCLDCSGRGYTR
jgi:DnaJ-class molecular chaperone